MDAPLSYVRCFNPLPHAEGDQWKPCKFVSVHCFNPLPHAEGDELVVYLAEDAASFNPLPHAEGDLLLLRDFGIKDVSIHSLTQRETESDCNIVLNLKCFNPLPHAEGDDAFSPLFEGFLEVSIHSLTQRETLLLPHFPCFHQCFNPLPHAEGDSLFLLCRPAFQEFQSTPSRRGRLYSPAPPRNGWNVSIHSLTQRETSWHVS